jgi:hypothetical protein
MVPVEIDENLLRQVSDLTKGNILEQQIIVNCQKSIKKLINLKKQKLRLLHIEMLPKDFIYG